MVDKKAMHGKQIYQGGSFQCYRAVNVSILTYQLK